MYTIQGFPKLSLSHGEMSPSLQINPLYPYYSCEPVLRSLLSVRDHGPDALPESRLETLLKVQPGPSRV